MNDASPFERALGACFAALSPPLRRFHRLAGRHVLPGEVTALAPASPLAALPLRAVGAVGGPRVATSGAIRFELDGEVGEQLGAARLMFTPEEDAGRLRMRLRAMRFLSAPCPAFLRPRIVAEETGEQHADGRALLLFRVEATVPLIGRVVGYRGPLWLPDDPAGEAARARG